MTRGSKTNSGGASVSQKSVQSGRASTASHRREQPPFSTVQIIQAALHPGNWASADGLAGTLLCISYSQQCIGRCKLDIQALKSSRQTMLICTVPNGLLGSERTHSSSANGRRCFGRPPPSCGMPECAVIKGSCRSTDTIRTQLTIRTILIPNHSH